MIACSCCGLPPRGVFKTETDFAGKQVVTCDVCERLQALGIVDRDGTLEVERVHRDED